MCVPCKWIFPFILHCLLTFFLHLAVVGNDKILGNVSSWLHGSVSWRGIVPEYGVFDVMAFHYMTHYAIHGDLSRYVSDIVHVKSRITFVRVFMFSIVLVALHPVVLGWHLLRRWDYCSPVQNFGIEYFVLFDCR